jgi:hypothetical protein
LVDFALALCRAHDRGENPADVPLTGETPQPGALRQAAQRLRQVVQGIAFYPEEDPRANVVEPQLGYALRRLEMSLQQGAGNGHGIIGIFAVQKS